MKQKSKHAIFLENLKTLPKGGIDEFLDYLHEIRRMKNKHNHGLTAPFTKDDYVGIFPIEWIASFGHYTEEEILGFVDDVVLRKMEISHVECIYRMLPISKVGMKLSVIEQKRLNRA